MSSIGKLERVELRQVWRNEAQGLTTWLEENIEILNEELGINLQDVERESSAGSFRVDLMAKTEDGRIAIIENQLEQSDHKHLGQLLTYLAFTGAKIAIWIVKEARPDHSAAIAWLNSSTDVDFYMVKLEAVRIGNSPPAPLFTLITGTSEKMKEIAHIKRESAERHELQAAWTKGLIEKSKVVGALHAKAKPATTRHLVCQLGRGIQLVHSTWKEKQGIKLSLKDSDRARNLEMFRIFEKHKESIETTFGESLVWDSMQEEGNLGCRIIFSIVGGGYRAPAEQWSDLQNKAVLVMQRFTKALTPYFSEVGIAPSL
jgi:hypothetical protein